MDEIKNIKEKILSTAFVQISIHFYKDIMNVYKHYSYYIHKYGLNCDIYKFSWNSWCICCWNVF